MQGQSIRVFWTRWVGDESTERRRSLIAAVVAVAALLSWIALVEWANTDELLTVLAAVVVIFGAGVFARSWLALASVFAAAVLMYWAIEIGNFLWIGSSEWEARNAEHCQGNEPALEKLIGQLMEYVVFGLFLLPIVALGVALGRVIEQQRHGHDNGRELGETGV